MFGKLHALPLVFFICGLIFSPGMSAAQVARIEYHSLPSVTLTDTEFLQGKKDGTPVTLAGELRIPRMGNDRLPAVILLHGSGGLGGTDGNNVVWSNLLNSAGIATFGIDSFTGRRIVMTAIDQTQLGRLAMIVDAYRAFDLLSRHPRIDPAHIALMGFSRGGQSALYASVQRFQRLHGPAEFAAYVAFYPDCTSTYHEDDVVTAAPIVMLHGSADNYNLATNCSSLVERIKRNGGDIRQIVYPGAYHVFDVPLFKEPFVPAQATTTRRCSVYEAENGQLIDRDTNQPFAYSDPCVEKGPTLLYDHDAAVQAQAFVGDLLNRVLLARN